VFIQFPIIVHTGLAIWLISMPGIHIADTWMELVLRVLVCTNVTSLVGIICLYAQNQFPIIICNIHQRYIHEGKFTQFLHLSSLLITTWF
jgi:LEA14-like dessication related protein